jgi:hypothetical protein
MRIAMRAESAVSGVWTTTSSNARKAIAPVKIAFTEAGRRD